jgi:hypothetical protein
MLRRSAMDTTVDFSTWPTEPTFHASKFANHLGDSTQSIRAIVAMLLGDTSPQTTSTLITGSRSSAHPLTVPRATTAPITYYQTQIGPICIALFYVLATKARMTVKATSAQMWTKEAPARSDTGSKTPCST